MITSENFAELGLHAMRRAARSAYEDAAMRGLKVPIWRDGHIEHVDAKELLQRINKLEAEDKAREAG